MAATRPSIMSEGATTWAPASACDTAIRASSVEGRDRSAPPRRRSARNGRATCTRTGRRRSRREGAGRRRESRAPPAGPRRSPRSHGCPPGSLASGRPNRITPAMPSCSTSRASRAASSTERWKQPGSEPISRRTPRPGAMKRGTPGRRGSGGFPGPSSQPLAAPQPPRPLGGEGHRLDVAAVVVIAEEEGIGAPPRAEDPAVLADAADRARPLEADRALLEPLILVARVAGDAFHGEASIPPARGPFRPRRAAAFVVLCVMPVYPEKPGPGGVAQLVRARGSYPRSPGFKSLHRHHFGLQNVPLAAANGSRALGSQRGGGLACPTLVVALRGRRFRLAPACAPLPGRVPPGGRPPRSRAAAGFRPRCRLLPPPVPALGVPLRVGGRTSGPAPPATAAASRTRHGGAPRPS